jgi:hypothetical protein
VKKVLERSFVGESPGLLALVAKFRDLPPGFPAAGCVTRRRRWSHQAGFVVARREVSKILNLLMTLAVAPVIMFVPKTTRFAALIRFGARLLLVLHADPEPARCATRK